MSEDLNHDRLTRDCYKCVFYPQYDYNSSICAPRRRIGMEDGNTNPCPNHYTIDEIQQVIKQRAEPIGNPDELPGWLKKAIMKRIQGVDPRHTAVYKEGLNDAYWDVLSFRRGQP